MEGVPRFEARMHPVEEEACPTARTVVLWSKNGHQAIVTGSPFSSKSRLVPFPSTW